ncbi:MAG: Lipopolysaccharide heptosyltransferase [Ignavibacteria bacterium]|nr:MAG: Lipopolysaccharide heptosyltransferase [Ignavibacteria bacterium]KAF0160921.1 MAG: Lipopolysaccharide heptosyltransferase [Ignavibacteria bacterium]
MPAREFFRFVNSSLLSSFLAVKDPDKSFPIEPQKFLVIRQHNQFGDMLASVSLLRAIKETYPNSYTVLLASPENYFAIEKNPYIDELFVFEKKRIFTKDYFKKFRKVLRQNYDVAVVPATVAVSNTSCLLASFTDAKFKVGPASLNGIENKLRKLFHGRIKLNWQKYPDAHVSDFILDVVRPYGITTKNYNSCVLYDEQDKKFTQDFLDSIRSGKENKVFGFHVGAAKPQNRWSLQKYAETIISLKQKISFDLYFTGSNSDEEQLTFIRRHFPNAGYFLNNTIPQLAAVIEKSDLFITNDTGVMHVAGTTNTPQISIFGPTNPFNWAPLGKNKFFLRKSELIDDVKPNDVVSLAIYLLENYA